MLATLSSCARRVSLVGYGRLHEGDRSLSQSDVNTLQKRIARACYFVTSQPARPLPRLAVPIFSATLCNARHLGPTIRRLWSREPGGQRLRHQAPRPQAMALPA